MTVLAADAIGAGVGDGRSPGASSRTFEKSPSNEGSSRRIRSTSGGWVASSPKSWPAPPALPKNMWLASSARGSWIVEPAASAPIFLSAPAMPSGLRVNCTAEASARNSRCRETAALIRFAKNTPTYPIT